MKPSFRWPSAILSLGVVTGFCGCSGGGDPDLPSAGLERGELRAEVVMLDRNGSEVVATVSGVGRSVSKPAIGAKARFRVAPGDFGYLAPGRTFKATIGPVLKNESGLETYTASQVWPDDLAIRKHLRSANFALRRDTLRRRDDIVRATGDILPPFALLDQDGNLVTADFFTGRRTVVNFIFTRCSMPEMCPASTRRMKRLQNLSRASAITDVQFLSITLDPEFDVPGILKEYATAYEIDESNFRFATGPKTVIDDILLQFGILRRPSETVSLNHTMSTLIVNDRRQIVHQVSGSGWTVEDFLARFHEGSQSQP